jgi:hypothetical protein
MKNLLFQPSRNAAVSRIKAIMPGCQDTDAQDIANRYQAYLRTGFTWLRPLKVLLLMMSFGFLSLIIAWLLAMAGFQFPKPYGEVVCYGFMCVSGLWMWIVLRWESRTRLREFMRDNYPQHAD